jgi:hypothetical protein
LEGLLSAQDKTLASGLKKLAEVFAEARIAGHESSIWEVIDSVAQAVPDDLQPQLDIFRTAVRTIIDARDGLDWIDELAQAYTMPPNPTAGAPSHQVAQRLQGVTWPGPEFADLLEAVQEAQPEMEDQHWSD